jgi:hypothetical protein
MVNVSFLCKWESSLIEAWIPVGVYPVAERGRNDNKKSSLLKPA